MEQVIGIDTQGTQRELTESLGIEKLIDPSNFATAVIQQTIRGSAGGLGVIHQ
jgi:Zn-dependent alcohol dehydrogenase